MVDKCIIMCYMVCLVVLIFVSKLNIGGLYIEE